MTDSFVESDHITTLMVTHNVHQTVEHGNRLVMVHNGEIILDVRGSGRAGLPVQGLLDLFQAEGKQRTECS